MRYALLPFLFMLVSCAQYKSKTGIYKNMGEFYKSSPQPSKADFKNDPSFLWPVKNYKMTRGFKSSKKKHLGLDLANKLNTPIIASHSGLIVYALSLIHI